MEGSFGGVIDPAFTLFSPCLPSPTITTTKVMVLLVSVVVYCVAECSIVCCAGLGLD